MLPKSIPAGNTIRLGGCVSGADALAIGRWFADAGQSALVVMPDEFALDQFAACIRFLYPQLQPITLQAWDCLPYDRISPSADVMAARMLALAQLALAKGPQLLLATVAAVMQKLPKPSALQKRHFVLDPASKLNTQALEEYLLHNGYQRVGTVREVGEFAWRGNLLDLFINGQEWPLRIDLFGDRIEQMHSFDPISQRKKSKIGTSEIHLASTQEVLLDAGTIQNFRQAYRQNFGAESMQDTIYESVSHGKRYAGMEHWLPFFDPDLGTVLDYLPGAVIVIAPGVPLAVQARDGEVLDYFTSRQQFFKSSSKQKDGGAYRPLPPELLYLDKAAWEAAAIGCAQIECHTGQAADGIQLPVQPISRVLPQQLQAKGQVLANLPDILQGLYQSSREVMLACYTDGSRERLHKMLADTGIAAERIDTWADFTGTRWRRPALAILPLEHGFGYGDYVVITEQDLLGDRLSRVGQRERKAENIILEAGSLAPGDYVVHNDHGIGRFTALETITAGGAGHDCLCLEYAGGDRLFVPVENIDVLSRYGSDEGAIALDKLGGVGWQSRKARVKQRIAEIAEQLIRIAAARQTRIAPVMPKPHNYDTFCARFPHFETEDQLKAIEQSIADLAAGRPMDRLVCGDVGFGKTEVALRAAFVAASSGAQVAVVVPTTLLARQHFANFKRRFDGLPLAIAQLSRFVGPQETQQIKQDLADGKVNIVIGTHALLAKSIQFANLGLVIVDEEQHFGVGQKERLKELQAEVHILTLSATPIPRTLQMALTGVRDLSIIATPPVDRHVVQTHVMPYDGMIIREAILRERHRGGQCFYVCPRIEDLAELGEQLRGLLPDIRLAQAHGQLPATALEQVMQDFVEQKFDVLLSTNIIESGLDIPSANTIIVHRADMFGLSQLYQLRGRVGRSKQRAYAYLTIPARHVPTETAQKRLQVMQTLDHLGAGFTVASHDMDIRGAGNLLGAEQSGHVREVGIELYQHLLQEAVANTREGKTTSAVDSLFRPQINLGIPVLIPAEYIIDLPTRMNFYRRISGIANDAETQTIAAEMIDRFGNLPAAVENLLTVVGIKNACLRLHIEKIDAGPKGLIISFYQNKFTQPDALVKLIQQQAGTVKLRPDHKLVMLRGFADDRAKITAIRDLIGKMQQLVDASAKAA
jgi:transcription-repair coupling factor (superfamily II helicase)